MMEVGAGWGGGEREREKLANGITARTVEKRSTKIAKKSIRFGQKFAFSNIYLWSCMICFQQYLLGANA